MYLSRRKLLLAGASGAAGPFLQAAPARLPQAYFGVHPFIEANPKAVFIRRTHVPHKMDEASKLREGPTLAREMFVAMDQPGVPVPARFTLKPHDSSVPSKVRQPGV